MRPLTGKLYYGGVVMGNKDNKKNEKKAGKNENKGVKKNDAVKTNQFRRENSPEQNGEDF